MELKDKTELAVTQRLVTGRSGFGNRWLSIRPDDIGASRTDPDTLFRVACEGMRDSHSIHLTSTTGGNLEPQL